MALGERDETRRRHHAARGIVPADERFDAAQVAVGERHLGLIDHVQAALISARSNPSSSPRSAAETHGCAIMA